MSSESINLTPQLYQYLQAVSLREPEVLKQLRAQTQKMTGSQMQISPEQGQLMALLIQILDAKKTLDIGTFTGYSALVVALALPDSGKVISCDISEESTKVAREYWQKANIANKIELRLGSAVDTLQQLINGGCAGSFDFAFIDADKGNYDAYYEKSLTLLRSGGLIAVDNVLWDGKVADPQDKDASTKAIRDLNAKIHADKRVTLSLIPIGDGLTLVRKR